MVRLTLIKLMLYFNMATPLGGIKCMEQYEDEKTKSFWTYIHLDNQIYSAYTIV